MLVTLETVVLLGGVKSNFNINFNMNLGIVQQQC